MACGLARTSSAMLDASSRKGRGVYALLYVLFVVAAPFILQTAFSPTGYTMGITILILAGYYAIAALGLNIIVGYCGLLNLGFAGFMLIGSYTTGILMKQFGFSFWSAAAISIAHGAFWGIVLGLPTLRLTGDYFAIVTFGFGELVKMLALNWVSLTRGPRGYPGVPRPKLFDYEFNLFGTGQQLFRIGDKAVRFDPRIAYWFLVAALLGLVMFVAERLLRSRLGRAWRALREDEVAAEACGINAMWYKTIAFAISAGIGALAGSFMAAYSTMADFRNFDFMVSVSVLAYVVLGGMGTVKGPVLGALVLVALGELLRKSPAVYLADVMGWWPAGRTWLLGLPWASEMRFIVYGLVLVLMIRFRPEGLLPSRSRARELHGEHRDGAQAVETSLFNLRTQ